MDPAGNLRFRIGFGSKAGPNQAQNIRHGTHKPAHDDSERFWPNFGADSAPEGIELDLVTDTAPNPMKL